MRQPAAARTAALCGGLIAANGAAWVWCWTNFGGDALLLGTAFLAYSFGLRHAVDADHIAAIDNATRKLIELDRPAATTGLFFSLGHATVVVLASIAVALTSAGFPAGFAALRPFAGTIGTGISAASLFALALANMVVLVSVARLLVVVKRGEPPAEQELARLLSRRGLLGWLLRGLFRVITKSWHLYPLGFLFGLGFDTATEIGLLAVSAMQAARGLPLAAIMVFPALFTAGMVLVDSLDGMIMAGVYRWAALAPYRKLYYNLAITAASVLVAVAIGGIEVLQLVGGDSGSANAFWRAVSVVNDHFGTIGAAVVALFAVGWIASMLMSRRSSLR